MERWCRLRGNLLFYFKSRDHWSEPAGVIVVENCAIIEAPQQLASASEPTYGILLIFGAEGNVQYNLMQIDFSMLKYLYPITV